MGSVGDSTTVLSPPATQIFFCTFLRKKENEHLEKKRFLTQKKKKKLEKKRKITENMSTSAKDVIFGLEKIHALAFDRKLHSI